jgi:hypothetical protein
MQTQTSHFAITNPFNHNSNQRGEWESQSTTKFLVEKPLLGGRHVSAPMLGHHQVSKKYLKRKLCRYRGLSNSGC